jgi:hypothetical protein
MSSATSVRSLCIEDRQSSNVDCVYPTSFNQEGILLAEEVKQINARYSAPHFPVAFRVTGALHRVALIRALTELTKRHDSLRTSLEATRRYSPSDRSIQLRLYRRTALFVPGLFQQRVINSSRISIKERYVSKAGNDSPIDSVVDEEIDEAFDSHNPHSPRALVVRVEDQFWLILLISHAVADGWSLQIVQRELPALYAAYSVGARCSLPPVSSSFGEFATAQHVQVGSGALDIAARYWLRQWTEFGECIIRHRDLPFARSTDDVRPAIRRQVKPFTSLESDALVMFARRLRTTPYVIVRTALTIVLYAYSGKPRVAFWANFANRDGISEDLLGYCANTHLIATHVDAGASCTFLARHIGSVLLDAQLHQALPVVALWRHTGRNLAAQCDCRINFDYVRELSTPDILALQPTLVGGGRRWMDLDVRLRLGRGGFVLHATYNSTRYGNEGVSEMLANVKRVLSRWLRNDAATVALCACAVK